MNGKERLKKAVEHYRSGGMIIVTDDFNRENEGDLMVSAQYITAEQISFMARYGRGLICLPIERSTAGRLNLLPMCRSNGSRYSTAFTISVDAAEGTTTGISAHDRLRTVQTVLNSESRETDLLRPGHLFPLIAADGGLKERKGHTEAAVELSRFAGHHPSGVICEIMSDDGSMTRGKDLADFARTHNLPLISIEEIEELLPDREEEPVFLPTDYGSFEMYHYASDLTEHMPHIALVHKEADLTGPVTVRLHSECLTGDIFGSLRCDCGNQLKQAFKIINEQKGVLLYMRQEGRGIGLVNKMKAYRLQEKGSDTVDANIELGFSPDERHYKDAALILKKLGIKEVELLTNNPLKVDGLIESGINVRKRIPLESFATPFSRHYLKTKKERMNHILEIREVM
ncbi:MAG: GTP cyclohydrolase II [Spirochaetales bacterium]|nr:GTP cyclohydrolase II [Spirochaetales bacterium]